MHFASHYHKNQSIRKFCSSRIQQPSFESKVILVWPVPEAEVWVVRGRRGSQASGSPAVVTQILTTIKPPLQSLEGGEGRKKPANRPHAVLQSVF